MPFSNSAPFEVIAAPLTLYIAAVDPVWPAIDEVPDSLVWTKVGSSGDLNYDQEGVTVEHPQTTTLWRSLGDAGSRKAFRQDEDLKIRLLLVDITLEQYKLALNENTVTTVAAAGPNAGYKKIGLSRGLTIVTRALLVRSPASPYGDGWNMQYEVPRAMQTGTPSVVYRRSTPAGLALEWTALVDPDAASEDERFGRLIAQHADPVS